MTKSLKKKKINNNNKAQTNKNIITNEKIIEYNTLSPFELKNKLITLANKNGTMLNAGRGNPNFYNDFVRKVFTNLQQICLTYGIPDNNSKDLSFFPQEPDKNLKNSLLKHINDSNQLKKEKEFLCNYINFLCDRSKDAKIDENTAHSRKT